MTGEVVYAVRKFQATLPSGGTLAVQQGSHWLDTDPLVKSHPDLFSRSPLYGLSFTEKPYDPATAVHPPTLADDRGSVEQATAAPGERRNTRRAQDKT